MYDLIQVQRDGQESKLAADQWGIKRGLRSFAWTPAPRRPF